ncbi:MAG: LamG-like jellyroll fold domain-containing protein [Candidatus Bipolaricaulota bacterium]|nr:LamG domain-containing protein [Candidatus Bipolaricaulota bacterium]MBS3791042.1 LamG domain-containing protein [Candidatus Bipolaricaulota bacterium]
MRVDVLRGSVVILLSILLVGFFVFSVELEAESSEEARLGKALAEVLLNWQLMVLNGPSYAKDGGLNSSLTSLEKAFEDINSPSFLANRIPPLLAKLERAKTEDVWTYQFGYWNFAQDDSTVNLAGAEKDEEILVKGNKDEGSDSSRLGFRFLKFALEEDSAVISVGEKLDTPLAEGFTLEFWVRFREGSRGKIVKSGNWKLGLKDSIPILENSSGDRILKGREIPPNYWTHVSLIWDGERVQLCQNGNPVNESRFSSPLNVSKEIALGGGMIGNIDELRIKDRSVEIEYLNFDRPIDYLIGFPTLSWVQDSFGPEKLWHFYAGLLVSNLSLKFDSDQYSVKGEDLRRVGDFLLTENGDNLSLPSALPARVVENLEEVQELENKGELTEEQENKIGRFIESLTSYLELG